MGDEDKGLPIPTRFDPRDELVIETLSRKTGLSKSEIIRRCVKYTAADIMELGPHILYELPESSNHSAPKQTNSRKRVRYSGSKKRAKK